MQRFLWILAMAVLSSPAARGDTADWNGKWDDDAYAEARRELTDKMFRDLKDETGTVPLRSVMLAYGSSDPTPRQVRRLLDYDPTGDGRVTREEMYYGFTAFIFFQVERHMSLDADEDGRLTRREHALQVPDDVGRRDEEGYVPRQRKYFEESDLNGDGVVTRDEVIEYFSTVYIRSYGGYFLGYKATSADVDGNGAIDLQEFALLQGQERPNRALRKQFEEEWGAEDGSIENLRFHDRFGRMSLEEQAEWERIVQPFYEAHRKQ